MLIDEKFAGYELRAVIAEIDRTMVRRFARAIGETDRVHYDDDAAIAAGYSGLPAPLTFPIALKTLAFALPDGGTILTEMFDAMGISSVNMLHGEQHIETKRPICAGDVVTISGRVEAIENKPDKGMAVIRERSLASVEGEGVIAEMKAAYVYRDPDFRR